jgi:7-cyano-7-deazaguanine synthase in queuosine biosynthesis
MLMAATQWQHHRITPLFFDYGQKAAEREKEAAEKLVPLLRERAKNGVTVDECRVYSVGGTDLFAWSRSPILKGREHRDNPDVENRNMVLISLALSVVLSDRKHGVTGKSGQCIAVGFKNEHYDTTRAFAAGLNAVTTSDGFCVEVITPLLQGACNRKVALQSLAKQFDGTDILPLLNGTWSCYYPTADGHPCGQCRPCKNRTHFLKELRLRSSKKSRS